MYRANVVSLVSVLKVKLALADIYPRERPGTHRTGGWVGPRAGVENLGPTGIRSPDRPARSQSLYSTTLPGPQFDPRTVQPVTSRYTPLRYLAHSAP